MTSAEGGTELSAVVSQNSADSSPSGAAKASSERARPMLTEEVVSESINLDGLPEEGVAEGGDASISPDIGSLAKARVYPVIPMYGVVFRRASLLTSLWIIVFMLLSYEMQKMDQESDDCFSSQCGFRKLTLCTFKAHYYPSAILKALAFAPAFFSQGWLLENIAGTKQRFTVVYTVVLVLDEIFPAPAQWKSLPVLSITLNIIWLVGVYILVFAWGAKYARRPRLLCFMGFMFALQFWCTNAWLRFLGMLKRKYVHTFPFLQVAVIVLLEKQYQNVFAKGWRRWASGAPVLVFSIITRWNSAVVETIRLVMLLIYANCQTEDSCIEGESQVIDCEPVWEGFKNMLISLATETIARLQLVSTFFYSCVKKVQYLPDDEKDLMLRSRLFAGYIPLFVGLVILVYWFMGRGREKIGSYPILAFLFFLNFVAEACADLLVIIVQRQLYANQKAPGGVPKETILETYQRLEQANEHLVPRLRKSDKPRPHDRSLDEFSAESFREDRIREPFYFSTHSMAGMFIVTHVVMAGCSGMFGAFRW